MSPRKTSKEATVRASISLPESHYDKLYELATQKRVSIAWIVRDAIEQYVAGASSVENGPDGERGSE